jgi:hypothetical protein
VITFFFIGFAFSNEDNILQFGNKLLKIDEAFDLSNVGSVSTKCRDDFLQYIKSLKNLDLWAIKLHDANAKLPSGLLNGNVNQYGDFDQCLRVISPTKSFTGKYCLAYLQPRHVQNEKLEAIRHHMQSYDNFNTEFEEPGHVVMRFSTIHWALCVPSSCSSLDIEIGLKEYIKKFTNGTNIQIRTQIADEMCHVKDPTWYSKISWTTILVICFFIGFLGFVGYSTYYEMEIPKDLQNPWLTSFSLINNWKQLISLQSSPGEIKIAHGIRFFNLAILLIAHKAMAMLYNPFINRTEIIESTEFSSITIRPAVLYTDTYLLLSAMLTSYSLFGRLNRGQKIQYFQDFVSRYIRIMPPIILLILFSIFIFPLLGNGPQWGTVVTPIETLCRKNWWRTIILIQNYFGFENICITHTHYVANDTQLFLMAPFVSYIIWKWPKKGSITVGALILLSAIGRFYVTYKYNLTDYVAFGTSITQLFATADYMYVLPYFRFVSYGIGIYLGYVIRNYRNIKLSERQINIGWYFAIFSLIVAFLYPLFTGMGSIGYEYNVIHSSFYSAISPIGWSIYLAWVIFISENGYENMPFKLLKHEFFMISTRVTYCVYLIQYTVFNYNIGTVRGAEHFGIIKTLLNLGEYFCIVFLAVIMTLLVDLPFGNIKKILFSSGVRPVAAPKLDHNQNYIDSNYKKSN